MPLLQEAALAAATYRAAGRVGLPREVCHEATQGGRQGQGWRGWGQGQRQGSQDRAGTNRRAAQGASCQAPRRAEGGGTASGGGGGGSHSSARGREGLRRGRPEALRPEAGERTGGAAQQAHHHGRPGGQLAPRRVLPEQQAAADGRGHARELGAGCGLLRVCPDEGDSGAGTGGHLDRRHSPGCKRHPAHGCGPDPDDQASGEAEEGSRAPNRQSTIGKPHEVSPGGGAGQVQQEPPGRVRLRREGQAQGGEAGPRSSGDGADAGGRGGQAARSGGVPVQGAPESCTVPARL